MSIQTLTRSAQVAYSETIKSERGAELDQVLFPSLDQSAAAEIEIDQYLHGASVMRVSTQGAPANVKLIEAGTRTSHVPPVHGEKVIIDGRLRDQTIAGTPETNWQATMQARINRILDGPDGFIESWLMARRKAAVDYLRTGKINLYDLESKSYQEFDFAREAANTFTYTFGAKDKNFDDAVKTAYTLARKHYSPTANLCVLLGSDWLSHFDRADEVVKKREATIATDLIQQNMIPPRLHNVEGLSVICRYRVGGVAQPIMVLSYEPNQQFKASPGAPPEPYVPDNQMFFFSLNSGGYRFYRGVDYLDSSGNVQRAVGGLVMDSFTESDPVAEILRAQSRFFYIPTNVNHTVAVTGQGL